MHIVFLLFILSCTTREFGSPLTKKTGTIKKNKLKKRIDAKFPILNMTEKAKSIKTTNKQATENFNKAISSFDSLL